MSDTEADHERVHWALTYLWLDLQGRANRVASTYEKYKDSEEPKGKLIAERCSAIMHELGNVSFHLGVMVERALKSPKAAVKRETAAREAGWVPPDEHAALLEKLRPTLEHRDEEYENDHWATGRCPLCLVEIALKLRDPRAGGKTLAENKRLAEERDEQCMDCGAIGPHACTGRPT